MDSRYVFFNQIKFNLLCEGVGCDICCAYDRADKYGFYVVLMGERDEEYIKTTNRTLRGMKLNGFIKEYVQEKSDEDTYFRIVI